MLVDSLAFLQVTQSNGHLGHTYKLSAYKQAT